MKPIQVITLAAAVAATFTLTAQAAETTIRFAHVDPAEWTTSKKGAAAKVFKQIVEGDTAGRIAVETFDSGSLGGETDLLQSAQDGTITMTMVSATYAKFCPEAAVLDIPYMFPSASVAWSVLDGEFGNQLADNCLAKSGLRTLAYGETGFRNFTNSKHPIRSPKDMEGLKIRVMTAPLFVEMVKGMGGKPTPISWPEVPTALATGVVDGQENPVSVIYANKFYEIQKYMTLDQHVYGTDFVLINETFYAGLSADDQAIIKNAAVVAGAVGRSIQQLNSSAGVGALIAEGMEVYKPTAAELAQFRASAQPAVVEWLATKIDRSWINSLQDAVADASK